MLINSVMPMNAAPVAESTLEMLQNGGRLLLMVAMTLFLTYILFLLGAAILSGLVTGIHALRSPNSTATAASVTQLPLPVDDGWGNQPNSGADERAMSA